MKPPAAPEFHPPPGAPDDASDPRFLWFRSWCGVYLFVLGCFVAVIVLLALFTRAYS